MTASRLSGWVWACLTATALAHPDAPQQGVSPDLGLIGAGAGRVVNRSASPLLDGRRHGVRLDERPGQGVAWIEQLDFGTGTIEVDVRGKDVLQRSFVGIAFHGATDSRYEVVYLRPFNFHPDFPWSKLRSGGLGSSKGVCGGLATLTTGFICASRCSASAFVGNAKPPSSMCRASAWGTRVR